MKCPLARQRLSGRGFVYPFRVFFCCCIFAALVSCYERIGVPLSPQPPVLVVEGGITTDSLQHTVRLTRTSGYFDTALASIPVSGAEVEVFDDSLRYPFDESVTEAGLYQSRIAFSGRPGATYRIEIQARLSASDPVRTYSAQETMPSRIRLDSVSSAYGKQRFGTGRGHGWSILLYATDPPEKNYYGYSFYVDGRSYNDSLRFITLVDDKWGEGIRLNGVPVVFFQSGKSKKMPVRSGSTVTIKVMGYTQAYFQWIGDIQAATKPNIPVFSSVPANCRGNVSNGAFGYFAAYSVARDSTVLSAQDSIRWHRHHR
ncbi:MAG: DUF4249 domain-containing protein [Bacteroides sp.]|nr:DUF4249 domain-containing protein [Bacteroides sp.]MCM1086071.1 DUF4249 domain-containing protein [Bacteroides sp.]